METAVIAPPAAESGIDRETFERAWRGTPDGDPSMPRPANRASLTIFRDAPGDFQDRQVYLWVDGEPWGKIKYGREVSREVPAGRHLIRANNTLLSHTLEVTLRPGEQVRVRCHNGMPPAGWLMMMFVHVTYLRVRLERQP